MEKRFTGKNDEIVLDHASADDGHWAEVAPETVRGLRESWKRTGIHQIR